MTIRHPNEGTTAKMTASHMFLLRVPMYSFLTTNSSVIMMVKIKWFRSLGGGQQATVGRLGQWQVGNHRGSASFTKSHSV